MDKEIQTGNGIMDNIQDQLSEKMGLTYLGANKTEAEKRFKVVGSNYENIVEYFYAVKTGIC